MKKNLTVRFSVGLLLLFLLTARYLLLTDVHADITNPQFIMMSGDDLWGAYNRAEYKDDTGIEFLISLSTEIKAYALGRNASIAPPKVVATWAVNPGWMERWINWQTNNRVAKFQQLLDQGTQFTTHGHTHTGITPTFLGELSGWDLYFELRAAMDWLRYRLNGCDIGFAFRHGGNTCGTCTKGKWSPDASLVARDLDCWPHGWAGLNLDYDYANWGSRVGGIYHTQDKWPCEIPLDGFTYWHNGGGYNVLPRIVLNSDINSWMTQWNTFYASSETPRAAIGMFLHDYDVNRADSRYTVDAVTARRDCMRQFLKTVLVDQNKRYNPSGQYENVYMITYNQYIEYYWLINGLPEASYTSVEDIINAGNMQAARYSVEPSTTVEAESMARKSGGSPVSGGWKLAAANDYIADIVDFRDEYCNYAIDIVAKGKQGTDGLWPRAQVKMTAMTRRLCKANTDEDKYFSEAGNVEVNSASYATYRINVAFPVQYSDRTLYALANGVVFKLMNPGSGKELEIDRVTFTRNAAVLQQGRDGYAGGNSGCFSGVFDTSGENMRIAAADDSIYVKFDLSSVTSQVSRVYAGIWCYFSDNASYGPSNLDVYRAATDWTGRPAIVGSKLDTKKLEFAGFMYEFDVTTAAIAALNSGNKTLSLCFKTDEAPVQGWNFWSSRKTSEPGLRPVLKVSYATTGSTDLTAPGAPAAVRDGTSSSADAASTSLSTQLSANWDAATDNESAITAYYYAIGTTAGGVDIVNWADNGTALAVTKTGTYTAGLTYYFTVRARSAGGTGPAANSNGQLVSSGGDTTPPGAPAAVRDGAGADINFTNSTTQLSANWDAAVDNESAVIAYYYAIGTSPGSTDVASWTALGNVLTVTKTGLSLTVNQIYYFSVKAASSGGTGPVRNSNGQTVTEEPIPDTSSIYPNPCDFSNGQVIKFKVGAAGSEFGEVKIYTISGKLVRKLIIENGAIETTWDGMNEDGEKITRGIYIYQITNVNGDRTEGKIAITR